MSIENGKIHIRFDHVGSGLATRDAQPPNAFEIAGKDGNFVKAQARLKRDPITSPPPDTVIVWSDQVPDPVTVRFARSLSAELIPNLINKEGLPASPFRAQP